MPMNENDRQNDRKNDRQDRPFERRDRRDRRDREQPESEWKERLVALNRVTKVVKGGKNFRFAALVVVGNEKGQVGAAIGKAKEVPEAIRKAKEAAMKHLVTVPMEGTTIPHAIDGLYGTAKVVLLPAEEGAGVIAGGGARAVLELAGVKDIRTKKPLPRCAARRWKKSWAKEDWKDETEDHPDQVPHRLPPGA